MPTVTAVTERPILFSGPMVRAILEGRKTQTRRVMSPQPQNGVGEKFPYARLRGEVMEFLHEKPDLDFPMYLFCWKAKYGVPGDRLWVRETWMPMTEDGVDIGVPIYRATDQPEPDGDRPLRWRPSIFMKREDSRITLEIVKVRVERVQDISEEDAEAEGIDMQAHCCACHENFPNSEVLFRGSADVCPKCKAECHTIVWDGHVECCGQVVAPKTTFESLWDSINEKRGFGWDKNPWVWVVEFKRLEGTNL